MAPSPAPRPSGLTGGILTVLAVVVIVLAGIAAIYLMQDRRSGSERAVDAISALPKGIDKAADQLGDQPPAKNVERNLGDAEKKVNDKVN